jgi:zinc D-Ala-D-Ala dipeptidase
MLKLTRLNHRFLSVLGLALLTANCAIIQKNGLPDGFVHLSQVDQSIVQDIRYAGTQNFIGRKVAGYDAAACIVTRTTADALAKAQSRLRPYGYTLVMFDCYRPARAVADFMAWTAIPGPADPQWRPNVAKDRLVPEGYIAARSGHSRGSTVDLGLARISGQNGASTPRISPCARIDHNTLDMGTPFDCFDPASATADTSVSLFGQANRQVLQTAMTSAGFRNYAAEWWHFTLINEPFPDQFFDFIVSGHDRK